MSGDYKELCNSAPVGLWRTQIKDGKFLFANDAFLDILGFSSFQELSQFCSTDLYDKKVRTEILEILNEAKEIKDFKVIMTGKNGYNVIVLLSAKIHPDKGYIEGTLKDITNLISFEAALIPHLEKISLLKQHILERIEENSMSSTNKFSKPV